MDKPLWNTQNNAEKRKNNNQLADKSEWFIMKYNQWLHNAIRGNQGDKLGRVFFIDVVNENCIKITEYHFRATNVLIQSQQATQKRPLKPQTNRRLTLLACHFFTFWRLNQIICSSQITRSQRSHRVCSCLMYALLTIATYLMVCETQCDYHLTIMVF